MAAKKKVSRVIRELCLSCQGGSPKLVRECVQDECALHALREGESSDATLHRAITVFCLACAGSPEAVQECTADQPVGNQRACPAHAFRTGQVVPEQRVRELPGLVVHFEAQAEEAKTPQNTVSATPHFLPADSGCAPFSSLEVFSVPEAPDI